MEKNTLATLNVGDRGVNCALVLRGYSCTQDAPEIALIGWCRLPFFFLLTGYSFDAVVLKYLADLVGVLIYSESGISLTSKFSGEFATLTTNWGRGLQDVS